jgi:hypothetical protein
MSKLFLAAAVRRLSVHRLALLAFCGVAGVALAASSAAAVGVAAPPGLTVEFVNQSGSSLTHQGASALWGSWVVAPQGPLANGATATYVAQLGSGPPGSGPPQFFGGSIQYYNNPYLILAVNGYADPSTPFSALCQNGNNVLTCNVQSATKTSPWIVTYSPVSSDTTPPTVQVQVAPSLVEESVRTAGVPVVVRSNEPARARVELLAQNGARHALLTRTLKWGNRDYPLMLRLNRAGLRALDVGKAYRLRARVTDRHGNLSTIERRILIR